MGTRFDPIHKFRPQLCFTPLRDYLWALRDCQGA